MLCRHWKRWSLLCVTVVALQAVAAAQTPVTLPPDSGTSAPATTSTFSLKRMWLEIVVTAGMAGLTLFAVCKSSARQ